MDIVGLWSAGLLPIADLMCFADGRSFAVEIVGDTVSDCGRFDLAEFMVETPEELAGFDVMVERPVLGGFVCAGEGSHGSEGFFARLDAARELVWVCHLLESNPFRDLFVAGNAVTVRSTSGVRLTVDLDSPLR